MNFSYLPPATRRIMIPSFILAIVCIVGVFYGLPYFMPDNPSNEALVQWRVPFIIAYLVFDFLGLLFIGIIGAGYIINPSGIEIKRFFKSTIIPWDAIERIQVHHDETIYLAIYISDDYNSYSLNNKKRFTLRHDEAIIKEIEIYHEVIK